MPEIQVIERTIKSPRETMEEMSVKDWFIEDESYEKSLREKASIIKKYTGKVFSVNLMPGTGKIKVTRKK